MSSAATVIVVDEDETSRQQTPDSDRNRPMKRKRSGSASNPLLNLTAEERSDKIEALDGELKGLFDFYKEINWNKEFQRYFDEGFTGSVDSAIAVLLEESLLPLSKLANEIYEKLNVKFGNDNKVFGGGGVGSLASVKSKVLLIGQRVYYGVLNVDADLLEDDSDSTLWCWETKDSKLVPKSFRNMLKMRRTCREKIKERINAVSAMVAALKNHGNNLNYRQELAKVSSKMSKLLSEADIRNIFSTLKDESVSALSEKAQEKLLVKQLEKSKRQEEKERRKIEQEQQKEDQQKEKELKRLHEEAEKEERKREKEDSDMKKRLKRQQEEAEKDQRRKEKEETELKRQRALQKQASVMDRFLKKAKTNEAAENDRSPGVAKCDSSPKRKKQIDSSVTHSMDSFLSLNNEMKSDDIWNLHLKSWHYFGHVIRSSKNVHWGIRKKPKTELVKELKLTANRGLTQDDTNTEMVDDGWADSNTDSTLYQTSTFKRCTNSGKRLKHKQLLQFDKSYRPAFYGIWPKTSLVIRPRLPFAKDPELDYEIDSDEEWEEEEPGESLSDCEKDGESLEEGCSKEHDDDDDDDDESEDGFFVPDGYLSENEGVEVDKLSSKPSDENASTQVSSEVLHNEELSQWFRQQKYLHNITELALKKTQLLVISNFKHEKASLVADSLTGTEKRDQLCLQALTICPFSAWQPIEISIDADVKEDQETCPSNSNVTVIASATASLESDLAQIVSVIQSCPHGMHKLVESLHDKFPSASKTQLRNKVREIAEFADNRWQVKKEILAKLGLTISPVADKRSGKTKSISAFFSKRCLPPGTAGNPTEVSPQSSRKTVASTLARPLQGSSS